MSLLSELTVCLGCGPSTLCPGACYALAVAPSASLDASEGVEYGLLAASILLLVHVPLLMMLACCNYSGVSWGGVAPLRSAVEYDGSADNGMCDGGGSGAATRPRRWLGLWLSIALVLAGSAGGTMLTLARVSISSASQRLASGAGGLANEPRPEQSEICSLIWGVDGVVRSTAGPQPQLQWVGDEGVEHWTGLVAEFAPHKPWAQEELRVMCALLAEPDNPITHSMASPASCLMQELYAFVNQTVNNYTWPLAEDDFVPAIHALLQQQSHLGNSVGFLPNPDTGYPNSRAAIPGPVAWIDYQLRSKYPSSSTMQLAGFPDHLATYRRQWADYYEALPSLVTAALPNFASQAHNRLRPPPCSSPLNGSSTSYTFSALTVPSISISTWQVAASPHWSEAVGRPPSGTPSVFSHGFSYCPQFALAPTLQSFVAVP